MNNTQGSGVFFVYHSKTDFQILHAIKKEIVYISPCRLENPCFDHTADWLESLYPRKVAFITATYVLYMNGKGQVSLFRGIPEMLSTTKSSFSSTIVSHRCRIDACFFIAKELARSLNQGKRGF